MAFETRDPAFFEVVDETAELIKVAGGFGFTEGPIWRARDSVLIFSDIQKSRQYQWSAAAGLTIFRAPSNQANGNVFDGDGRVISCEHASSHLVRHEHDGKLVRVIASHYRGRELNSPNDVVVDRLGRIWFTDPTFGRIRADLGVLRAPAQPHQGVYRLDPGAAELALVVDDFKQPNGLCFARDEAQLFINDSWGPHIRVFDVAEDGSLSGGAIWAEVAGSGEGVPDGMKMDRAGRLYCNGPGGVHVFDAAARCLGVIQTPEKSTNFCFGGPQMTSLFITASTSVYRIELRVAG